ALRCPPFAYTTLFRSGIAVVFTLRVPPIKRGFHSVIADEGGNNLPRLLPPCSTRCVNSAISFNQLTAPDDLPLTPRAIALRGRSVLPLVPTPPPLLIISITSLRCSPIPPRLSLGNGIT